MLRRAMKNASGLRPPQKGRSPEERLSQALEFHRAGRLPEAAQVYGQILADDPDHVDALHLLGVAAMQSGDAEGAVSLIDRALVLKPDFADAYSNKSSALMELGRFEDALSACDTALRYAPANAVAWFNAGNALSRLGRPDDAVVRFAKALEIRPDFIEARNNMGAELVDLGRTEDALVCLNKTVQDDPTHVRAYVNLANAHSQAGDRKQAVASLERAVSIDPGHAKARVNLSNLLLAEGNVSGAVREANAALTMEPVLPESFAAIGACYRVLGHPGEACQAYRDALSQSPGASAVHSNLLLSMLGDASVSGSEIRDEALRYAVRHAPRCSRPAIRNKVPKKIGFVSPDFRIHPVGFFLEPLLANLSGFEVHLYSSSDVQDSQTKKLAALADHFVPCKGLSGASLAEQVRNDGIDVLIDLAGHTSDNRLDAFALRPAPVQLTWLGYSGTTGLSQFDGLIGDPTVTPRSAEDEYSEQVYRLPHSFTCLSCWDDLPPVGPLPLARNAYVTFASFNVTTKINPAVVEAWCRVLRSVDGSRMVIKNFYLGDTAARSHFAAQFDANGVSMDRLEMIGHTDRTAHLATVSGVDVALDTFPYSGATTTLDCLSMGVPVVTKTGDRYVSNMSASFLRTAGFGHLVADSVDGFVDTAVRLASDPSALGEFRAGARAALSASPLGDAKLFASSFEKIVMKVWEDRVAEAA